MKTKICTYLKTVVTLLLSVLMLVCSFTAAAADWYNASWQYRKLITIDRTRVAGTLTDFPMLVDVTDADLAAKAQTDADDILFTAADGTTKLSHEIELYQSTTGHLLAWVKIPSLSSAADTTIYMYYGNTGAGNQQDATGVWDANYRMVQHLEETSGTVTDSTANANNGTAVNGVTQGTAGKIDGAVLINNSNPANNRHINCGSSETLDNVNPLTFEAWININSYGESSAGRIFSKAAASGRLFFTDGQAPVTSTQRVNFYQSFATGYNQWATPAGSLLTGQWYHVAVAYDGSSPANVPQIYVNGSVKTLTTISNTGAGAAFIDASYDFLLGIRGSDNDRDFDGLMDEVRVSSGLRSAQWIATEYNNQSNPAGFYTVGAEAALTQTPELSNVNPADRALSVSVSLSELSFTLSDPQGDVMSYEVTASPDIIGGMQSGSGIASGMTIHIPVTGGPLSYGAGYSWSVHVSDGVHEVTANYTFTTGPAPGPWWDAGWPFRKEIRIDSNKVVADVTGFPVLINITDSDIAAHAQISGNDIVFTSKAGTRLNHESELYDQLTGHLIAWVSTDLSASIDTILYVYYGNPTAADQQNKAAVWDADYAMVQHLAEPSGSHYDSTSNNNIGAPEHGVMQGAAGRIDGADSFDGADDDVNFGSRSSLNDLNPFTFEAWVYVDAYGTFSRIFDKGGKRLFMVDETKHSLNFYQLFSNTNGHGQWETPVDSLISGQWNHVAVSYDGASTANTPTITINGVVQTVNLNHTPSGAYVSDAPFSLLIGNRETSDRAFDGIIDEVRVSRVARGAEWLLTQYRNQSNPSGFCTLGSREINPGYPVVSRPDPSNGATLVLVSLSNISFTLTDPENDVMDYTVTTSPDIGSDAKTGVGNGIYTLSVSGLSYDTTYTWTVTATDGVHETVRTMTFTTRPDNYTPVISNVSPEDGSTNAGLNPRLSAQVTDGDGELMNITFSFNNGSTWEVLQTHNNAVSGTYTAATAGYMSKPHTLYQWKVTADDQHGHVVEKTFQFTTGDVLREKWRKTTGAAGGLYAADIDGDGAMEIVAASFGKVFALRGTDGSQKWVYNESNIDYATVLIEDLDNDGLPEVLGQYTDMANVNNGLFALHGDGSVYWKAKNNMPGFEAWSHPLAFDIDGDGYPTIYWTGNDECQGTSRICAISSEGDRLYERQICKCCAGGVSIADYDFDGVFEIYMGDRNYGTYGKGVQSWWASDLSPRWNQQAVHSSSAEPIMIDVTGDGLLDIVSASVQDRGVAVLSAKDGKFIINDSQVGLPAHQCPAVYDVDGDGRLEFISSEADTNMPFNKAISIWDLTARNRDASLPVPGGSHHPPVIADVDGDGKMELVSATGQYFSNAAHDLFIFKHNPATNSYDQIQRVPLSIGGIYSPLVQDVDNDGLNEVVIIGNNGIMIAYDTSAPAPNPRARSGMEGYSEYRRKVAEYVERPGPKHPMQADEYPANNTENVDFNSELAVRVWDYQWDVFSITFRTNASGTWEDIVTYNDIARYSQDSPSRRTWGVYRAQPANMNQHDTMYTWSVSAVDAKGNSFEKFYQFRTKPDPGAAIISNPVPAQGATNIPVTLAELRFDVTDPQGDLIDYTVTTTPNIGSGSASGVTGGTMSIPVSGLAIQHNLYLERSCH